MAEIKNFEDFHVGDVYSENRIVSKQDVRLFAKLSGDTNALHESDEFARELGFQGAVVFGILLASYVSKVIGVGLPGNGALWMSQNFEFENPCFIGDEIVVKGEIVSKSESTSSITVQTKIVNHKSGVTLMSGKGVVRTPKKKNIMASKDVVKNVLILGGSGAVGMHLAKKLAVEGYKVLATSNSNANVLKQSIKEDGLEGKIIPYNVDLLSAASISKFMNNLSGKELPNSIVHCASLKPVNRSVEEASVKDFEDQFQIAVGATQTILKYLLPTMRENNFGRVIFIGSQYAQGRPPKNVGSYAVAKTAMMALAKAVAVENGHHGITSNVILPSMMETNFTAELPPKAKLLAKTEATLKRFAEPEDIFSLVRYLISEDAAFVNGSAVPINSGAIMF